MSKFYVNYSYKGNRFIFSKTKIGPENSIRLNAYKYFKINSVTKVIKM